MHIRLIYLVLVRLRIAIVVVGIIGALFGCSKKLG